MRTLVLWPFSIDETLCSFTNACAKCRNLWWFIYLFIFLNCCLFIILNCTVSHCISEFIKYESCVASDVFLKRDCLMCYMFNSRVIFYFCLQLCLAVLSRKFAQI